MSIHPTPKPANDATGLELMAKGELDRLNREYAERALLWAARFTMTPEQARTISMSAHRQLDLQLAMQAHLHAEALRSVRTCSGAVLLPTYLETRLGRAWDAYGREFMAIAEREYSAALAHVVRVAGGVV